MIEKAPIFWVFVLILFQVATVTTCPSRCTCSFKETACQNAALTSIPSDISEDTTCIRISHNNITTLQSGDLTDLNKLSIVIMNDNGIQSIEPKVFHPLKKLKHLYLNNNQLTRLPYKTFRKLKALRCLFLENNKINYIDPRLFKYVIKLEVLDISRNSIKKLEPNTFQYNRLLSWVNIRHNPYIETLDWKPLFEQSFNFLNIQFCEEQNNSLDVYKGAPELEGNLEESPCMKSQLNKQLYKGNDKLVKDENLVMKYSFIRPETLSFHEYDTLIRTIGYDEYNTVISRESYYITVLTDYPIFCYCKNQSLWFWCYKLKADCSSNMSMLVMFTVSKCSSHGANKLLLPASILPTSTTSRGDSKSRKNEVFPYPGKSGENNNNTEHIIIYGTIAIGIIIIIVIIAQLCIQKKKRSRETGSSSENQTYELRNTNGGPPNGNADSSLLQDP